MDGFPSISIQKKMRDMSLIPLMENYLKNAWNMMDFMLVLIPHSMISKLFQKNSPYISAQGFSCSETLPPQTALRHVQHSQFGGESTL